jgi:hypothetical protein
VPTVKRESLEFAVRCVAGHGDTDVFPFPLENHWLHDDTETVVELLAEIDSGFSKCVASYPVTFTKALAGVGYTGFRAATQIDPIWNAYLLALTVEIAGDIERTRIPEVERTVFSYRLLRDSARFTMFNPAVGWGAFQTEAIARSASSEFVLATDVSDFYSRIYHHRLKNALMETTSNKEAVSRIDTLLSHLSGNTSYGLPVGGNAARVLAEGLLDSTDRLLLSAGIRFVRFVDDYYIFANSVGEAQSSLVYLSECLLIEGLTLARAKTRLMSRAEFLRSSPVAELNTAESKGESDTRAFLAIRLKYDPYSATANEDYELLASELRRFDVVGMLARELHKSRVDEILVRQLVKSIRFLAPQVRRQAIDSLIQNLGVLYPVLPTVLILLRQLLGDLDDEQQSRVFHSLRFLLESRSHIALVPTNLAFIVRLLAYDPDRSTDKLLVAIYGQRADMMIKRDVVLAMARRKARYWLSPLLKRFNELTPWERRAALVASYALGDEGSHVRQRVRPRLNDVERLFGEWVARKNSGLPWDIPV